eukprot:4801557-Pleurochrysis_carterae.AAC.1
MREERGREDKRLENERETGGGVRQRREKRESGRKKGERDGVRKFHAAFAYIPAITHTQRTPYFVILDSSGSTRKQQLKGEAGHCHVCPFATTSSFIIINPRKLQKS